MVKSTRFLWQFVWVNLSAIFAFAAIVVGGCYITGVPQGAQNLFKSYFQAFPLMILFILYMYGFALCTNSLNLALSFGARRRDVFWGIQGTLLLYTAVCWLLQLFMSSLPALGNWTQLGRPWVMGGNGGLALFPLLCLTALVLGSLSGMAMARSRALGVILIVAAVLALLAGSVVLFILADLELWSFLLGSEWSFMWGRLPYLLLGLALLALAVGEAVIWRTVKGYAVR